MSTVHLLLSSVVVAACAHTPALQVSVVQRSASSHD
jgi:hypothetical protein